MIAYLHGKLAESTPTHVVVDCQGVGYSVFIPLSSYDKLPPRGGDVKLLTYHHVIAQDGTQQLYGFVTAEEREMFLLLISISGIGPKLAVNILSSTSISALRNAIASGDTKTLSTLRGIGKKTAERLVVELKDKIGGAAASKRRAVPPPPRNRGSPTPSSLSFRLATNKSTPIRPFSPPPGKWAQRPASKSSCAPRCEVRRSARRGQRQKELRMLTYAQAMVRISRAMSRMINK